MQIVFELESELSPRAIVMNVTKIDDKDMFGLVNGHQRCFPIASVRNAVTVSGRPFSLRPYDAATVKHQ